MVDRGNGGYGRQGKAPWLTLLGTPNGGTRWRGVERGERGVGGGVEGALEDGGDGRWA